MNELLKQFIGKTIEFINDSPDSPGIIITFSDGTKLVLKSGAFGGFHAEIM